MIKIIEYRDEFKKEVSDLIVSIYVFISIYPPLYLLMLVGVCIPQHL